MIEVSDIAAVDATADNADARRNALANCWTLRGIDLLNENTRESLTESLRCFEEAIVLRRSLPVMGNPWFCYGLTAGWMNRGDALTRLGDDLAEAVRSYDEALALLRTMPIDADQRFRTRLAIAWMNRGLTLQEQGTLESLAEAIHSFEEAIAAPGHSLAAGREENRPILACAWMNRGNALLRLSPPEALAVRDSVEQALALVAETEKHDLLAAETGLKARYILCQATVEVLAADPSLSPTAAADLLAVATDAVDDGLALAWEWEACGVTRFRDLVSGLFCFGARAYQLHQPHFLMKFLLNGLDPKQSRGAFADHPEMHRAASEAIRSTFGEILRDGFDVLGFDRLLARLQELRVTEARLAQLRTCHLA